MILSRIDKKFFRIFFFRFVGNYLILISIFLILKTFYEPIVSEARFFVDNTLLKRTYIISSLSPKQDQGIFHPPATSQLASFFNIPQVELMHPIDPSFSIMIPKIAANARIIPNVNVANEAEYLEKLKLGVAHAAGTYFPGQNGHIFLFAHSTDYVWNINTYNAVFYLLYKLEKDDEIDVFFQGARHVYQVTGKKVVDPTDIEYLTRKTDGELLTLQTCWPPGTTLKRLLIIAKPKIE